MEPEYSLKRKADYNIEPNTAHKNARHDISINSKIAALEAAENLYPHKKKTSGRTITHGKAASNSEVTNLTDGIYQHAYLRIQIFHAVAMKLNGVARRTGRSPTKIKGSVGKAPKQDGRGSRNENAAHANTASGFTEDLKVNYRAQIYEGGITPIKADVLNRIRNIPAEVLDAMHNNHTDKEFIDQLFELIWPGDTLLSDTDFEDQINATNKLPTSLNLGCDLSLEKSIRPYQAELWIDVMRGTLNPRVATNYYVQAIQNHFVKRLEEITEHLNNLKKADCLDAQEIAKWQNQLFYHQTEMNGTQSLDYDLFEGKKKLEF